MTSGTDSTVFTVGGTAVSATWAGTAGTATRTLTYTVAAGQNGQAAINETALRTALIAAISDAAGNAFASGTIANIDASALPVIDTTGPTLSGTPSMALSTVAGTAGNSAGETITLTITFDGNVNGLTSGTDSTVFKVSGTGVSATWGGTAGTATRTLTYTVASGQNGQASIDEAALKAALIAGISDAAGNAFTYTANSGSIPEIDTGATVLPVIDTTAPALSSSTLPSTSLSTVAGTAGNSAGETITLTITFDGNVNGLTSGTDSTVFTVAGTGVSATWGGTAGTSTRTLTYTVAPGQNGQAAINETALKTALIAGISDAAGNAFTYSTAIANIDPAALPVIDTTAPTSLSLGLSQDSGSNGDSITNNPRIKIGAFELYNNLNLNPASAAVVLPGLTTVNGLTAGQILGTVTGYSSNSLVAKIIKVSTTSATQFLGWLTYFDGTYTFGVEVNLYNDTVNSQPVVKVALNSYLRATTGDVMANSAFNWYGAGTWQVGNTEMISLNQLQIKAAASTDAIELDTMLEYSVDSGAWGANYVAPTAQGAHTVQMRQTDKAGNTALSNVLSFTIDSVGPTALTLTLSQDNGVSTTDGLTSNPRIRAGAYEVYGGLNLFPAQGGGQILPGLTTVAGLSADRISATMNGIYIVAPVAAVVAQQVTATATEYRAWIAVASSSGTAAVLVQLLNETLYGQPVVRAYGLDQRYAPGANRIGDASFDWSTALPYGASGEYSVRELRFKPTSSTDSFEMRSTVEYSVDSGAWAGSYSPLTSQGAHTVQMRQTDTNGNITLSNVLSYTLDTVGPTALTLTLSHDSGASSTDRLTDNPRIKAGAYEVYGGLNLFPAQGGGQILPGVTTVAGLTAARISATMNGSYIGSPVGAVVAQEVTATATEYKAWIAIGSSGGTKAVLVQLLNETLNGQPVVRAYGLDQRYSAGANRIGDASFDWTTAQQYGLSGEYSVRELRIKPSSSTDSFELLSTIEYSLNSGAWSGSYSPPTTAGTHTVQMRQTDTLGNVTLSNVLTFQLDPTMATPLVLDLNGDGVRTTGMENGVLFDVRADGHPALVGWTDGKDGLLVLDLNGDGQISDGSELFGNGSSTPAGKAADGFAALRQYDINEDGLIDVRDEVFSRLQVWVDKNLDGISNVDELRSLTSLGIASLNLHALVGTQVDNGNTLGLVSSWTDTSGSQHELADVWFVASNLETLLQQPRQLVDMHADPASNVKDISYADVLAVDQRMIVVKSGANDVLNIDRSGWINSGITASYGDHVYALWSHGAAHLMVDQNTALHQVL